MKGWIYFARFGVEGPIKIGRANDPRQRVRTLTSSSPVPISLLGAVLSQHVEKEEKVIHKRLHEACIRGEWFEAKAALREMSRLEVRLVTPEALKGMEALNDALACGVAIRVRQHELVMWKRAAKRADEPLSLWVRKMLNLAAVSSVSPGVPDEQIDLPLTKKRAP